MVCYETSMKEGLGFFWEGGGETKGTNKEQGTAWIFPVCLVQWDMVCACGINMTVWTTHCFDLATKNKP